MSLVVKLSLHTLYVRQEYFSCGIEKTYSMEGNKLGSTTGNFGEFCGVWIVSALTVIYFKFLLTYDILNSVCQTEFRISYGTETVQVTPLRRTLVSCP